MTEKKLSRTNYSAMLVDGKSYRIRSRDECSFGLNIMYRWVIIAENGRALLTYFYTVIKSIYSYSMFVFLPAGQEYLFPDEAVLVSPLHYKAVSMLWF